MIFSISSDNNVMTHDVAPEAQEGVIVFTSQKELAAATAGWPTSRYVDVWNGFAGTPGPFAKLKEIRKFTDRKTAVQRLWNVLHILGLGDAEKDLAAMKEAVDAKKAAQDAPLEEAATTLPAGKEKAPKGRKVAKKAEHRKAGKKLAKASGTAREGSKKARVIAMLERKGGATLAEIAKEMGWQNHTVRGFISGTLGKKMGLIVESFKNDKGERAYKLGK